MAETKKLTLTNFMSQARTFLGLAAAGLVVITIWQVGAKMYERSRPTPLPPRPQPNYAFGALPAIRFPSQVSSEKPTAYSLAIGGVDTTMPESWPVFANQLVIEVYKLKPLAFSLTADQKARDIAQNLDFYENPKILDDRTYLFTYPGPPLEENLQIDLKTMFLTLNTNFLATSNLFGLTINGDKMIPDRVGALMAVRNYLKKAGILPDDLSDQAATVEYVKAVGNKLEPVTNFLEADFVTVNLPRLPLDGLINGQPTKYNFYGPQNISSVYGVVGKDLDGKNVVVKLEDYYYSLNLDEAATYPLRTTVAAWQSLQAGEAYVINPRKVTNAVIRRVEVGYFESHKEQQFLLPIYVFYGDNGVIAYVQGLDPRVIQ